MRLSLSLFAAAAALLGGVLGSNVVDLDPDNFETLIGKGTPALVELCVLRCAHRMNTC
jgi:protein disulfide-isomerase A6